MQSSNHTETSTPALSGQHPFAESDINDLALALQQQIAQGASTCHQTIQSQLATLWADTAAALTSLPQRMVSDHVSMEDPAGLPYYHPLHWFRSQLAVQHPGVLEFTNAATATDTIQEVLNQLQPVITAAIAGQQATIVEALDQHVQDLRQSLVPIIQPQLSDPRIIITEYINSQVPLPQLQLSEVDRFGFFQKGKRFNPGSLVAATTKTVRPWYLLGLYEQKISRYQVSIADLQPVLQESLDRSFQNIKTKVNDYIHQDLQGQIQRLLAHVK